MPPSSVGYGGGAIAVEAARFEPKMLANESDAMTGMPLAADTLTKELPFSNACTRYGFTSSFMVWPGDTAEARKTITADRFIGKMILLSSKTLDRPLFATAFEKA